jgi:hypothetical protein
LDRVDGGRKTCLSCVFFGPVDDDVISKLAGAEVFFDDNALCFVDQ